MNPLLSLVLPALTTTMVMIMMTTNTAAISYRLFCYVVVVDKMVYMTLFTQLTVPCEHLGNQFSRVEPRSNGPAFNEICL